MDDQGEDSSDDDAQHVKKEMSTTPANDIAVRSTSCCYGNHLSPSRRCWRCCQVQ